MKKSKSKIWIGAGLTLAALYLGIGWYFSGVLIDFRTRPLEEDRQNLKIESPAQFGLTDGRDFELESQGIVLKGWFYPASGKARCGIVFHHGFTGTRYGAMKYAPIFQKYGCDELFYDARKHGQSGGKYGTYGYYEKQDLINVINWLEKERGLKDINVGLVGESFGAATSLMAAGSSGREFAFVLAESPYRDLHTIVEQRGEADYGPVIHLFIPLAFWIAELRADFDADETSVLRYAPAIKTPVFLIHSKQDDYTSPENSQSVFDHLTGLSDDQKGLYFTDWGASHARSIDVNREGFTREVQGFLEKIHAEKRLNGTDTTP
ncbi:MAG: prolyl oligopeptidase family serine peptidase [Leptospiraceae bacterium]|nr:prolyl oligopeptidase family serine peptidase [Leptospiraceae bacterium]MCB1306007.1 prolyl oligopeptidase family serine peptidase [Leptospiraceae bacterium]